MIDRSLIGKDGPLQQIVVERGPLAFFARVVGSTDPAHTDVAAAQAAGYRDLVVPPSYVFSLSSLAETDAPWVERLGVDLAKILHAEQRFEHHGHIYAGDTVAFRSQIKNVYEKKGGALEFVERETDAYVGGELRARLMTVLVVRHG